MMETNFDFLGLCQHRYSCRAYTDQPVEKEKLDYILECARLAPSAVNKQPWSLRVVTDKATLEGLAAAYDRPWFRTAPMVIAVSVSPEHAWVRMHDQKSHADIDGSIIAEHICLAASAAGLGSCWVCNFDPASARKAMALGDDEQLLALIPIGYPADAPKPKSRKPLSEILK